MSIGVHVLGKIRGCPVELLSKVDNVKDILQQTVADAQLTQVGETYHQFEPQGVTAVILLSESHISVHTWPEQGLVVADIFTCGKEGNAEKAFDILTNHFKSSDVEKQVVKR